MEPKEQVLTHFQKLADAFGGIYDGRQSSLLYKMMDILFRSRILEKRRESIVKFSGDVRNKKILDIGCGSGRYAISLAKKNPKLILGIDISPSMIQLARSNSRDRGLDKICRFQNLDFLDTKFQDEFDIIIAAGIFDYVQQPQIFLSKIRDILKDKAILSFPIKWTLMTPLRMAWLSMRKCPNFYYTKGQIKRLLNLCGFKIISIYRIGSFLVPGNYVAVCKGGEEI